MYCDKECPEGFYDVDCKKKCDCVNGGVCDGATGICYNNSIFVLKFMWRTKILFVLGECKCLPGFRGAKCEQSCPAMMYGLDCSQNCSCLRGNTLKCDATNGTCVCKPPFRGR